MRKKRNKQVPSYAFGIDQIAGIGQLLGAGIQGLSGRSSVEAGMEAVPTSGQALGSTLGSAATGAGAGFTVGGPIGAAVGGVAGLVGGLFGNNAKKKAIERRNRQRRTLRTTEAGLNLQAGLESDYYDENALAYTFANGGIMPTNMAFVDNSEVLRDLSGNFAQVPNTQSGTDEHLINTSTLESALSPNLKRSRGGETFAKAGEKVMRKYKPSKGNDRFAEATNELNKLHANEAYDSLLMEQENMKRKRGIKPKMKGIPAYEDGWWKKAWNSLLNEVSAPGRHILNAGNQLVKDISSLGGATAEKDMPGFLGYDRLQAGGSDTQGYIGSPTVGQWGSVARFDGTQDVNGVTGAAILGRNPIVNPVAKTATPALNTPIPQTLSYGAAKSANNVPAIPARTASDKLTAPQNTGVTVPELATLDSFGIPNPVNTGTSVQSPTAPRFGNYGDLLALTPTIYNWVQGMRTPEQEVPQINPYSGSINRSLARRRMNINPMINANRNSRAIANYNAANLNANTGANLALRAQMAADEYTNNSDIYATKQTADNQYLADHANTMNNLGQQYTTSKQYTNDINAANRAAARNYTGTAASQLGQWAQVQQQMNNQQRNDDMVYPLLETFLSQGYTQEQIEAIRSKYANNRRGRRYGR